VNTGLDGIGKVLNKEEFYMPNKKVDDLKNAGSRAAAQQWQSALGVKNLTTREWDNAAFLASQGKSHNQIKKEILQDRK
jgi:hypothetical protein